MLFIYVGCFTFGIIYSLLSIIFRGSERTQYAEAEPFLGMIIITGVIFTFGAVGLISQLGFKLEDIISSIFASCMSFAVGVILFLCAKRIESGN